MPVSKYFNHTNNIYEQHLLEDIFCEVIQLTGTEAFYIPRNASQGDPVYGEDPLKTFTTNFPIEVYNTDTMEFEGMKETFSKFGIQIKDDYSVLLSRKTFLQRVQANSNGNYTRPLEGDLIWMPYVRGTGILYEITFCNPVPETAFGVLGKREPYYYQLKLEAFKYSQELIQTGMPDVDIISGEDAYTISFTMSANNSQGNYSVTEQVYQGTSLPSATAVAYVSYWDNPSLTLNVTNISGVFATNANVIGSISNAIYTLVSYDSLQANLIREPFDNEVILDEGESYLNLSESNPLGQI